MPRPACPKTYDHYSNQMDLVKYKIKVSVDYWLEALTYNRLVYNCCIYAGLNPAWTTVRKPQWSGGSSWSPLLLDCLGLK